MAGPLGSTSAGGRSSACLGAEVELGALFRSGVSPTSTAPWLVDDEEELCAGCCASNGDGNSNRAIALETSPANRRETKVRCDKRNNIDMMETCLSLCSARPRVKRAAASQVSRERRHRQRLSTTTPRTGCPNTRAGSKTLKSNRSSSSEWVAAILAGQRPRGSRRLAPRH